ncbi:MAG: GNAT family N-acetyltransferase [Comamonas sp.]|jgi:phosphinothricin acetyltransferase|uniref:GNAT family N-acetyltransferase n=1 Tax=Comamonas sp. JUb58 TaxID=2485114 RepID=UPI00105FA661|nr:GNAT family N-acetyltransferase [Comamonas sp. JUb58]MDR2329230.1 GNAT family N-acetyltransferase [Comamonas sp.]TDS85348.1 phosphinothricin acetyltransferase [Comamonas sp. JUb58]
MPSVRASTPQDLPAITRIYAHHVLHGTGSFETEAPSEAEMTRRRDEVLSRQLPYLVAEDADGQILGFAYANWFKARPAYRFSAEDSIYVADGQHGRGLGRLLMNALIEHCEAAGVRKLIAVIGDSNNLGSVGVHRAAGFSQVGVMRSVGWKFGRWLDIVMMEKTLGDGDNSAPTT